MSEWRYIATRLNGDGTETFLEYDIPLREVTVRNELSGPGGLVGKISPEILRLKVDGEPMFVPWSTAIYAEASGQIRGGGILTELVEIGPQLALDCAGFTAYAADMPYADEFSQRDVDPLAVAKHIWMHIQAQRDGHLALKLDGDTSPVRIGNEVSGSPRGAQEKASKTKPEPYKLNWWETHDLGQEFDSLARETPFDYVTSHEWDGDRIEHTLTMRYPMIKNRRHNLRFVVGENIAIMPRVDYDGDTYASEVLVMGAGEGRKAVIARERRPMPKGSRLRRAVVVSNKRIKTQARANALAEAELKARSGEADFSEVIVKDHPNAPIGSVNPGDEIFIQSSDSWTDAMDLWCRVLAVVIEPELGIYRLTVTRVDKVS